VKPPRRKSGISAACALESTPNVTAANNNLRIPTLQIEYRLGHDHRSLTLTNRCRSAFVDAFARKIEGARE